MDLEKLKIKPFEILVKFAGMLCILKVEQTYLSAVREIFTIIDANGSFQIASDRPLIKSNPYSKKKTNYKAIDARVEQVSFLKQLSQLLKNIFIN